MIGLGIIGLGEAGEMHTTNTAIHKPVQETPPVGLVAKSRRLAGRLLHGTPQPAPIRRGIEGARLVGISDVDQRRIDSITQAFEISFATTNYKELLMRKDVDAVLICTPPAFHEQIATEAAQRGKHIFCEKPLAMTSAECERIIEVTEREGVTLQVGYMLRFASEREHIAAAIRTNKLGRPIFYQEHFNLAAGGTQMWIHDRRTGGGPLFENSHPIDFARYVFGDPEAVFAIGGNFKPNKISAYDTYAVSMMFPSGDRALIGDSYALKNFGWDDTACRLGRVEIDVAGPGGYIQFPDRDQSWNLTICSYAEPQDHIQKIRWKNFWGADGYVPEIEHFLECIRNKKTPKMDGHEAMRTVQLCETILHSIDTGKVCKFEASMPDTTLARARA